MRRSDKLLLGIGGCVAAVSDIGVFSEISFSCFTDGVFWLLILVAGANWVVPCWRTAWVALVLLGVAVGHAGILFWVAAQSNETFYEGMMTDVKVLRRAVFGNTDPGQSLVVRVERLEQQLMAMRRVSWATLCGVAGILLQALANWAFRLLMP